MDKKAIIMTTMVFLSAVTLAIGGDFRSGDYQRSSQGQNEMRPQRGQEMRPKGPGGLMGKVFQDSMTKRVLQDLTGQVIESSDSSQRIDVLSILDQAGIDEESFRQAMDTETISMAQNAADCGLITQDEADSIVEKVNNRPPAPQMRSERRTQAQ